MESNKVTLIAMIGENTRVIGDKGKLPWRIKTDMERFKAMTTGNVVIMGRKTFESMRSRPLPNRKNIVISRTMPTMSGIIIVRSIQESLEVAHFQKTEKIFIIGGEEIYRLSMPFANTLELTLVKDDKAEGDTFFPNYSDEFSPVDEGESHQEGDLFFKFITFKKTAT